MITKPCGCVDNELGLVSPCQAHRIALALNAGATPFESSKVESAQSLSSSSVTSSLLVRLETLIQKWNSEYQTAIEHDRKHGLRDTTTELGGKAIAADELSALLRITEDPK